MHFPILFLSFFIIQKCSAQSTSSVDDSSTSTSPSYTSTYANSSPSSSSSSSSSSGSTNSFYSTTTDSDALNLDDAEKLVTYTTGQKTIFLACCGGTFVLLIALAILSGLSDTIARSRQKTKRTHA
ncbi:unnamed protein product [Caenorhabditis sp. 36 PRJEB53466]|nr:unnamed protein product [Caenorhabditis sp. 36 PRJEB53466]